jgi:drug/metabolite transporter (DMT)-like permease
MHWSLTTLICAFSLASADAATKRYFSDCLPSAILAVRLFGMAAILFPVWLVQPWPDLPVAFWAWLAVLVPVEVLALRLYMQAISVGDLSRTLPYLAFTPVCTTLTGYVLLGESVSLTGFGGILLVAIGAYSFNLHKVKEAGRWRWLSPLRAILQEHGSRLMLIVALLFSLTATLEKNMLRYASPLFFGPFFVCILSASALMLAWLQDRTVLNMVKQRPAAACLVALAATGEAVTHYIALQQIQVAYMLAVKRTSLLFGVVYGAWLFKEARLAQNLISGSVMLLGVYFIAS